VGEMAEELITKIKAAARYKVAAQPAAVPVASGGGVWDRLQVRPARRTQGSGKIIAIGASSGGPHALRYLLPRLPSDLDAGIVIVQHMPESFTAMLARWLDDICALEVREAKQGDLVVPGKVLIAPGNLHLRVKRRPLGGEVMLESGPLVSGHIPSVDVLFRSVASEYGGAATGVIMTGMGSDGAVGIGEMKRAGGYTMAQDEESCAIFGMPRVAIERGFIDKVVSLTEMAVHLVSAVGQLKLIGESHVG
jgi:two-component system chemotaxis response regulator CheB